MEYLVVEGQVYEMCLGKTRRGLMRWFHLVQERKNKQAVINTVMES